MASMDVFPAIFNELFAPFRFGSSTGANRRTSTRPPSVCDAYFGVLTLYEGEDWVPGRSDEQRSHMGKYFLPTKPEPAARFHSA
jgi:hypothetical protein